MSGGAVPGDNRLIWLELRRGWKVVLSVMAGIGFGQTLLVYCFSAFVAPLEAEFGWSRKAIGFSSTFMAAGFLLFGGLVGRLCDRHGARSVILPSIPLFALALAAMSLMGQSVWWLYAGFSIATAVGMGTTAIAYTRVISSWFDKARGLALGISTMGGGMSALIMPPILTAVIDGSGWRAGWLLCAIAAAIAFVPVYLFVKDNPRADGGAVIADRIGATIGEAMRGYRFWCLAATAVILGIFSSGTVLHLMPMLAEQGFSRGVSAGYASLLGAGIISGRIVAGLLLDRLPGPPVAAGLIMGAVSGMLLLYFGVSAAVPLAIFLIGLTIGSEGDCLAFFTSRYFGMRSYGEIYGWLFVLIALGLGVGPTIVAVLHEAGGGYALVYLAFAASCFVLACLTMFLGRYPRWDEASAEETAPPPVERGAAPAGAA